MTRTAGAIGLRLALLTVLAGCTHPSLVRGDGGIPRCAPGAANDFLSLDALQCWFDAAHGRWRILSHESHYDLLVVQIQVRDGRDAEEIARRVVDGERETFSEILVYAQPESSGETARIRRVSWTRDEGFEILDFTAPAIR